MSPVQWQTLRSSIEKMRDNAKRFAEQSISRETQAGMYAQVEVLEIVLNEMTTIELAS